KSKPAVSVWLIASVKSLRVGRETELTPIVLDWSVTMGLVTELPDHSTRIVGERAGPTWWVIHRVGHACHFLADFSASSQARWNDGAARRPGRSVRTNT